MRGFTKQKPREKKVSNMGKEASAKGLNGFFIHIKARATPKRFN